MRLWVFCAMCGTEKLIRFDNPTPADGDKTLANVIEDSSWIVQRNGNSLDIYCSKKCAA